MSPEANVSAEPQEAPRVIGPVGAFSVVAGSMIGVGIFIFLDDIAAGVGSLPLFFGMLILGGFFAVCGSVACGELGAMMPKAGGDYVFQRAAYGRSVAFASGWVLFAAIFAGSIAALSIAVFQYQIGPLIGVDLMQPVLGPIKGAQLCAIGLVVVFSGLNDLGASLSAKTQTILTLAPILFMGVLALAILIVQPTVVHPPTGDELKVLPPAITLAGLATGFAAVNFIFSGWINIIYVAAEVREPGKNVPRSMLSATAAVTLLYVLVAAAFVSVLGLDGVASSGTPELGFDAGTRTANALGGQFAPLVLVVIALALMTSVNATIMAGARVGYAMAKDNAFWRPIGVLSGPRGVPRRSLWFQSAIAIVIILTGTGTADDIGEMASLAMFVTGSLTVAAVFVLRKKMPDAPRPYKATLYPLLPALYLVLALAAIAAKMAVAVQKDGLAAWYPLVGLGIFGSMLVAHLVATSRWKSALAVLVGFVLGGAVFKSLTRPASEAHAAEPSALTLEDTPAHDPATH